MTPWDRDDVLSRRAFLGSMAAATIAPSLVACGSSGGESGEGAETKATGKTERFTIEVGDVPKYSLTEIAVSAGSTVEVTLQHTGELPKASMGHNFVLLKQDVDMASFAAQAVGAVANDYIPPQAEASVIAHTSMIGGGESDTVTFQAPPPGTYRYLCTFPGHYAQMNGKLTVS
ncbi:MAG TPA: azurin [Polyangiaceae bacterium LLY-WYZ-14_1]|nr:azurin [Polyangiaceae bacterium LLY-WYZ-14_1]